MFLPSSPLSLNRVCCGLDHRALSSGFRSVADHVYSRKASFLGDSNFPHSVDAYVKGLKIKLYQDLYERYSNLVLTIKADRPIAIKGLETRLMRAFGSRGGFGVFDIYFPRDLLWQRSGDTLQRIHESYPCVPSWSWMAYDGGIRYMDGPPGEVEWSKDITSPFAGRDVPNDPSRFQLYGDYEMLGLEIKATAWNITEIPDDRIIMDQWDRFLARPLKCVIIGKSKTPTAGRGYTHYVLVVSYMDHFASWERVGAGLLDGKCIALSGSGIEVRIR